MDPCEKGWKITLLRQRKRNSRGMQKINAQVAVGGNQSAQSNGSRAPASPKMAGGIWEWPRGRAGIGKRTHHDITDAGVQENLQSQCREQRERHVPLWVLRPPADDQRALESAVSKDQ